MAYKGKYQPSFPRKYKGDPTNIIFRSLWEKKFMNYCDKNKNVSLLKGKFTSTLKDFDKKIDILHIDCVLYESYKEFLNL